MSTRKTNFEVLRIVAMFMVICGHVTINTNKLGATGTVDYFITNFLLKYVDNGVEKFSRKYVSS